jgi:hypothetical protein
MPKKIIDAFDLEAEREGSAVRRHNSTICRPFGWGKRIIKQRKGHLDGESKIEVRIHNRGKWIIEKGGCA